MKELEIAIKRQEAARIICQISALNIWTTFKIEDETLYVGGGKITDQQRVLITAHKPLIIWFLTTPPETGGMCRHGHEIKWVCNRFGCWVCECYTAEGATHGYTNASQRPPLLDNASGVTTAA